MRRETERTAAKTQDVSLPGGCLLCGGDLALRITETGAQTFCPACRWISRAVVHRDRDGQTVHIVHPGLVA
jgi:hypothetical protein